MTDKHPPISVEAPQSAGVKCDAYKSVTELCADHDNLREYIGQLERQRDSAMASIAALETQVAVMRDEEAQRVKLKAVQMLIDKNQQESDRKSREAMESIGISTHWAYNAGKTVGAMVLELVEMVKKPQKQTTAKVVTEAMVERAAAAFWREENKNEPGGGNMWPLCGDGSAERGKRIAALYRDRMRDALTAALEGET